MKYFRVYFDGFIISLFSFHYIFFNRSFENILNDHFSDIVKMLYQFLFPLSKKDAGYKHFLKTYNLNLVILWSIKVTLLPIIHQYLSLIIKYI